MAKSLAELIAAMPKVPSAVPRVPPGSPAQGTGKTLEKQQGYPGSPGSPAKHREPAAKYDEEERPAIMAEAELPPFTDLHRIDDVPGFAGVIPISNQERFRLNLRLLKGGRS
ncbi:MAG: hypothetical protein AB7T01_05120 [Acidithiobacillus sp.]